MRTIVASIESLPEGRRNGTRLTGRRTPGQVRLEWGIPGPYDECVGLEERAMSPTGTVPSLDRIDHVAVSVDNIAEAVAWYVKTFRCEVTYQDDTWAFLDFENTKLALVIPEQHPPHFAFTNRDAASFGPLKTHRDGTRSTYVKDPAGNSIEIMAAD
jgi:catechol 2,3-dioxygenase-like lactoylglutathione lyase family enzyme